MPIRAGSGGLKYPLPSQAQLYAQQSAAAASAGGSAASSAYGANRALAGQSRKLRYDEMQSALDRDFRAQETMFTQDAQDLRLNAELRNRDYLQLKSQQFQAGQQESAQGFQAGQREQAQGFQAGQADLNRQAVIDRDKRQAEERRAEFEMGQDARIQQGIMTGKLILPPATQQEMNKLESGKAAIKNLTPDQQAEFQQKYEAEKRRLLRTAQPNLGPGPSAQFNQGVTHVNAQGQGFDHPVDGSTPYMKSGKGWVPVGADQAKQHDAQQKAHDTAVAKQFDAIKKEVDAAGKPLYRDDAEAAAMAVKRVTALENAKREHQAQVKAGGVGGLIAQQNASVPGQPNAAAPGQGQIPPDAKWINGTAYLNNADGSWTALTDDNGNLLPTNSAAVPTPPAPGTTPPNASAAPSTQPVFQPPPAGAPPGTVWVDQDTLRAPDGTYHRRKGLIQSRVGAAALNAGGGY